MPVVALVTWLVTAVLGFTMLYLWISKGGLQAARGGTDRSSRFAPELVFGHFLLAAAGLIVWIVYVAADTEALTWIAFVLLIAVAVLGDLLFLRWWRGRGSDAVESGLPKPIVYTHGVFAVTTIVLVLLTALGVGES
jgi:manganese efflux pump family protein